MGIGRDFNETINGVPVRLSMYFFRGPEGGSHRGWSARRMDTGALLIDFTETRKSARAAAAHKIELAG